MRATMAKHGVRHKSVSVAPPQAGVGASGLASDALVNLPRPLVAEKVITAEVIDSGEHQNDFSCHPRVNHRSDRRLSTTAEAGDQYNQSRLGAIR